MPADTISRTTSTGSPGQGKVAGSRLSLRLLAVSALLLALPFPSSAGLEAQNTKLDLTINPDGLLVRSLTLWDPLGAFGQVGNQAYGYLWPMGPFFLLGDLASLPGWVVQRLWIGLVLVVAFQGAARLARELGVRHDLAVVLGALAYALSPRLLSTVGPIGIEAWPSALAPWVLLALVVGSRRGSARRYALGAALGIGMVGGVNAAATFATIPLGAVWLLTRAAGPRRRTLMLWWPAFTALVCLWWLVPLVVLGRYSPPFLDYIETAGITTFPTNLFTSLRGTSAWIPYVEGTWQAGSQLIASPFLVLNSLVLVVLGLLGIVMRSQPHRTFLGLGLLVGLLMVTFGHTVGLGGIVAEQQAALLDGVLAPFRNVHKFDPVIRLPMVLGLAHVLDRALASWDERRATEQEQPQELSDRLERGFTTLSVVGLTVIALAGSTSPAWTGRLMAGDGYQDVPAYWRSAAAWLGEDPAARSMLLPASDFGEYVWGTTQDEPLQPLAEAPWSVRGALPLVPIGNIRMLDAIEERVSRGEGSAALTEYLRRVGITYLVVRNDLVRNDDVADAALVHQALVDSPGIEFAQGFGPQLGGKPRIDGQAGSLFINGGWQDSYNAVEIFEVTNPSGQAATASEAPVVIGAPENILSLTEMGVLSDEPTRLAYDADTDRPPGGPVLLTDGLRLRDRFFGRQHDGYSQTLTPSEAAEITDRRDYEVTTDDAWSTVASLEGIERVSASSALSDPRTLGGSRVDRAPFAAVDGDPATEWTSAADDLDDPHVRVDLESETSATSVTVTAGRATARRTVLRVRTANGTSEEFSVDPGDEVEVELPSGPTDWVQVEHGSGRADDQISVAEIAVPGMTATRWLHTPEVPDAWGEPSVIALDAAPDARNGCASIDGSLRCRPGVAHLGEEPSAMRRVVDLPSGGDYDVALTAVPRSGRAVEDLLSEDLLVDASVSSASVPGVSAAGALAAIDGNPGTTWISSAFDIAPTLTVRWLAPQRIRGLRIEVDDTVAGREPTTVKVTHGDEEQVVELGDDGRAVLEPFRASSVSVTVTGTVNGTDLDLAGNPSTVGVAISELSFVGRDAPTVLLSDEATDFGCGSGPDLTSGPDVWRTSVVASQLDLHLGRTVDLRPCGADTLELSEGENRIQLGSTTALSPGSVVLTRTDATAPGAVTDAEVEGDTVRTAGGGLLVLRHNANAGWQGTADGQELDPVVVDGWQQGYVLPDGVAEVTSEFAPNTRYQLGLAVGAVALLLCFLLYGWWRVREPRDERPAEDTPARWATTLAAPAWLGGIVLMAGWWGLAVAVVTWVVLTLLRRWDELRLWVGLSPVVVVGAWSALRPWAGSDEWSGQYAFPQLLIVVPLALLAFELVAGRRLPTPRNRISGRSTTR
jgi:arabinofuranan 3-O-arabinosyltransferase